LILSIFFVFSYFRAFVIMFSKAASVQELASDHMIEPLAMQTFLTPAEMVAIVEDPAASLIGIIVLPDQCSTLFDALESFLTNTNRKVVRIAGGESVVNRIKPKPKPQETSARTPSEWRERLIAELREEQRRARQMVQDCKQAGMAPNPSDRDSASWLAEGLRDLLGDPITGAAFITPNKGAIARLAADENGARFLETDFLRPESIRFMEAGRAAQSMLTKLSLSSTNQFRVAAAGLMNRIVDRLAEARTEKTRLPNVPDTLLVEDAESLAGFVNGDFTGSLVVAAADEDSLRRWLPASALLYRYTEPVAAVIQPPTPIVEIEPLTIAFDAEVARARLFVDRGVLEELPQSAVGTRNEAALNSLREILALAWRQWFLSQLADLDAERFVSFEAFNKFARMVAFLQDSWQSTSEITLPVPTSAHHLDLVESIISELHQLQREWSIELILETARNA
jgi:hypothetical protein